MTFKSPTQPLCRYCGKPIRKRTDSVRFGFNGQHKDDKNIVKPKTKAEAQRYVNGKIVSIKWAYCDDRPEHEQSLHDRQDYLVKNHIHWVTVWDGESYIDEFFCNGDHAQRYAYVMVSSPKNTLILPKYADAIKVRKGE